MYVREFGAAWPNPDLRPFAGRPPVKSKCMGFAGYFARCFPPLTWPAQNSVHTGCSCGSVPPPSGKHFSIYQLHICKFHTGILACLVDNIFINFSHRSLRTFGVFFSFFETICLTILSQFYHGDQTTWKTSWRFRCIWQSIIIQYVQIEPGVNSDPENGSFWVEIRDANHVDRCCWRSTRFRSHQLTSDLGDVYFFLEMLAMVVSESSFGACVCHRRPAGLHRD